VEIIFGIVFGTLSAVISLACTAFWLWMLVDCIINEPTTGHDKLVWALVIVFLPFLGSILYYVVRRPERFRTCGR